jgi:hypothetical protein
MTADQLRDLRAQARTFEREHGHDEPHNRRAGSAAGERSRSNRRTRRRAAARAKEWLADMNAAAVRYNELEGQHNGVLQPGRTR